MKKIIILLFCIPFFSYGNSPNKDIKIVHESVNRVKQLFQYYNQDIVPLLKRYETQTHVIFNSYERKQIEGFWTQLIDHRIILHTIYNSYKSENNDYQKNLIKYTSNLHLQLSAAVLSENLWKSSGARKKLNETNINQIPRGSFINLENELFSNLNNLIEDSLPTMFPVNYLKKDKELYLAFDRDPGTEIEIELENINRQSQAKLNSYLTFIKSPKNRSEVKKRFLIYKFKNIFYTISTKISTWLGDTKGKNRNPDYYNGQTLIDIKMAEKMEEKVQPGDIMISRTNWFLSNAFLPGFWPHSFLYIGNKSKLINYFNTGEVNKFFSDTCVLENIKCNNLSSYLEKSPKTKNAWSNYQLKDKYGFDKILLEATSDGVHFSSLRHTFLNDYLAALRPKLSKLNKAKSIVEAIENFGLEYDFDFDYQTDDKLVCSELVAKAYSSHNDKTGINMNFDIDNGKYLEVIVGRLALSVIGFVNKAFDENKMNSRKSELEFVAFLKGIRKTKKSVFSNESEFYKTRNWKKWSFMRD